jgi:signal transduction histidine kinase
LEHSSESAPLQAGGVFPPSILMECDRGGRLTSMSEGAHAAFGEPETISEVLWKVSPPGPAGLLRLAAPARFSPVLRHGESMWITAELAKTAETAAAFDGGALLDLEFDFLRHYFRLEIAERSLSARARRLRGQGGGRAILQVERERQRLGRELHTGVGQALAAIRLQVEIVVSRLVNAPAAAHEGLERISALANDSLEYVRSVSRRLHPPEWHRLSIEDALAQLWQMSGIPERYESSIEIAQLPAEPPLEIKILIYRAAQEALSNLRHSRATRIHMSLSHEPGRLVLTVEDNGVGFDVGKLLSAPASLGAGIGLRSIREQAASLGGKLAIQSGSNGTKLEVAAPLPDAES